MEFTLTQRQSKFSETEAHSWGFQIQVRLFPCVHKEVIDCSILTLVLHCI